MLLVVIDSIERRIFSLIFPLLRHRSAKLSLLDSQSSSCKHHSPTRSSLSHGTRSLSRYPIRLSLRGLRSTCIPNSRALPSQFTMVDTSRCVPIPLQEPFDIHSPRFIAPIRRGFAFIVLRFSDSLTIENHRSNDRVHRTILLTKVERITHHRALPTDDRIAANRSYLPLGNHDGI